MARTFHTLLSLALAAAIPAAAAGAAGDYPTSAALGSKPGAAVTSPTLAVPRTDIPGVGNFARISDTLFRGAQPTAEGFRELKKMGIKTVVNLRSYHSDRDELKGTGLQYAHIYSQAWDPDDDDILAFLKIVEDPANQPVFVHCMHGADRTGWVVAVYRIIEQGWSVDDAWREMQNFGHHEVFKGLERYLRKMKPDDIRRQVQKTPKPRIRVIGNE
jgi:tyrosine-protein phosphatase SIW14